MVDLIIDPEFKDLIPPLKPDEYRDLEKNLVDVGFESERGKIIAWHGIKGVDTLTHVMIAVMLRLWKYYEIKDFMLLSHI